jgi:hypothetical protein
LDEGVVVVAVVDDVVVAIDGWDTDPPEVCPVTCARPCAGRLNAGDGLGSCSTSLFAARNA